MAYSPIIYDYGSSVPLWLAARIGAQGSPLFALGASDIPAILGASNFRGPWDVYNDHHGPKHDDPADENDIRTRGHLVEPLLMRHYAKATGREINSSLLILADPDHPWRRVSTDAIIAGERVIEGKTFSHANKLGWSRRDMLEPTPIREAVIRGLIPDTYSYQVIFQAAVAGVPIVDMVAAQCSTSRMAAVASDGTVLDPVWVLEAKPFVVSVSVSPSIIRWLMDQVGEWRERHLIQGIEPDPDGSKAQVRRYVSRMGHGVFPANQDIREAASKLARLRVAKREAADAEKLAKGELVALFGQDSTACEPDNVRQWVAESE